MLDLAMELSLSADLGLGNKTLSLPAGALAVYSVVRNAGYSGPCLRVVRVSDSAELDIGFAASGFVDIAAATVFQGASTLTVKTLYDQSGNANHATQSVSGSQPKFSSLAKYLGQQMIPFADIDEIITGTKRYFDLPSSVSVDRRNYTTAGLFAPGSSGNLHSLSAVGTDTTTRMVMFNQNSPTAAVLDGVSSILTLTPSAIPVRSGPTFIAVRSNSSNVKLFNAGTSHTSAAATAAGTAIGGQVGYGFGSSSSLRGDLFAWALYPAALSDGDVALVKAAYEAVWPIAAGTKTRLFVVQGDSISEGDGAYAHQNRSRVTINAMGSSDIDYYNMAQSGFTAATLYSQRVATLTKQYSASYAKKALLLNPGINDIKGGTSGATLWQNGATNGVSLHAQYAIGGGYDVAIGTLIKCPSLSGPQETERLAYNALVLANAAGIGARVIDYAADDANMTYFDTTHPDNAGYALMSARELSTVRTMLGL